MEVYLTTLGCRLNEAEVERWGRRLRADGHRVAQSPDTADVLVINTCAVTGEAARKSRKLLSGLHRRNPRARVVLTGCFATLEAERARSLAGVDLVIDNRDKERLVPLVMEAFAVPTMPELATEPDAVHVYSERGSERRSERGPGCGPERAPADGLSADAGEFQTKTRLPIVATGTAKETTEGDTDAQAGRRRTRAFIKVQDGCRNRCTFCIVTVARGEERSREIGDIVAEVQALANAGYREAVLTGVHLGGYGSDLSSSSGALGSGNDLTALVEAVLADTDIARLRLSSLEPWDLPHGFWRLWQNPRLMPHLHLPLQSGADAVLRRMARRSSTGQFAQLVKDARDAIPDLAITTDIIVGFPGETESEWQETVEYVQRIGFSHIHIFSYSRREGTRAARLPNQVPTARKKARSRALHHIAGEMKRAHFAHMMHRTRPVLWEGEGDWLGPQGDVGSTRRFSGYTDNYLRVETVVPAGVDLNNVISATHLLGVAEHGHGLVGTVVDDVMTDYCQ